MGHITGFGQRGGVANAERHIQHPRQRAGKQSFTAAGGAHQKHVAFFQFHFGKFALFVGIFQLALQAAVMVVNCHSQNFFGFILTDNVLIQLGFDFRRSRNFQIADDLGGFAQLGGGTAGSVLAGLFIFAQHIAAGVDAVLANQRIVAPRDHLTGAPVIHRTAAE